MQHGEDTGAPTLSTSFLGMQRGRGWAGVELKRMDLPVRDIHRGTGAPLQGASMGPRLPTAEYPTLPSPPEVMNRVGDPCAQKAATPAVCSPQ